MILKSEAFGNGRLKATS